MAPGEWEIGEAFAHRLNLYSWQCMPVHSFAEMFTERPTVYELTPYHRERERVVAFLDANHIAYKVIRQSSELVLLHLKPQDVETFLEGGV